MRVTFLTQDDPLYILPFFESLFARDLEGIEIGSIFVCRSMGNRKRTKLVGELVRLYGVPGFVRLASLQIRERTASALRLGRLTGTCHSLQELAEARGISCRRMGNPNAPENYAAIRADAPELLVSVACPFILKRDLLDVARRAAINIHHAPLPRYKGMMPTFWQMYHGEKSVGISIHTMAEEVDGGQIIYRGSIPTITGESMHRLIRRSKRAGADAMFDVLQQYARGVAPAPLEQSSASSYFTFPTSSEMRAFRQRGLRAI
jgi:methionyl-tRNA formyltransferase